MARAVAVTKVIKVTRAVNASPKKDNSLISIEIGKPMYVSCIQGHPKLKPLRNKNLRMHGFVLKGTNQHIHAQTYSTSSEATPQMALSPGMLIFKKAAERSVEPGNSV